MKFQDSDLAPYATKVSGTKGRHIPEPPSASRSEFQRDRDRIIHSGAFRKLRNKTQVFVESEGDYYRTRLTHSLEVAQIARTMARVLRLDEDLAEAVALAHDLGHTCFGHTGEDGLAAAMKSYGGFSHNEQAFRILTKLENTYARFDGLNLSWETLEGIVKHNGPITDLSDLPTLRAFNAEWDLELGTFAGPEAQIAALSDDIAYNTHDVDDGYRAGFFTMAELLELPLFGDALRKAQKLYPGVAEEKIIHEAVRDVIGMLTKDVLETTRDNLAKLNPQSATDIRHAKQVTVDFSADMLKQLNVLRKFLYERMYYHDKIKEVRVKAEKIVRGLFDHYLAKPNLMPEAWTKQIAATPDINAKARIIADYIAGMTDRFAIREYRKLIDPEMVV